jgi:hypothetical protein
MAQQLHIVCHRPGLRRGGVTHPAHQVHAPDAFSAEQLAEMLAEPELTLIFGERATLAKPPLKKAQ